LDEITNIEKSQEILSNPEQLKLKLRGDSEVISIANNIDYRDQISLLEYGKDTVNSISTFSDKILATVKNSDLEQSGTLLNQLGKLMDKFDKKDFAEDKGFLTKLFNKGNKLIEKLLNKYQSMGGEIDKIYVEIMKYETEDEKNDFNVRRNV